jgi:UDP-3-O-[3-hydroxymyristoyl] glucosamine N-acyltransferase
MIKKVRVKELIDSMQEEHRVLGSLNRHIGSTYPINQADDDSLCFCRGKGKRALEMIRSSKASVIICSNRLDFSEADYQDKTLIQVSNPRLTFSRLLTKHFLHRPKPGIHPTAIINEKARIGHKVFIGSHSYIADCEIGDNTIIEGNVYIHEGTKIGKNVIIHPGVVIGTEAVAFERNEKGELEWFPQLGSVVIEDDVEIGANTHVARGALPRGDTVIGKGTKLDALVEVGHGVKIGQHCLIIGLTVLFGQAKIGDYTQISSLVCVREKVSIGSRVLVGTGSIVTKDIPGNVVAIGSPAKPICENVFLDS